MGSSLALSCNIRLFVIELDYGYRYMLEVYSELLSMCFLSWLRYHSMLALYDRPVLETVSLLSLELYQLLPFQSCGSAVVPGCHSMNWSLGRVANQALNTMLAP